MGQNHEFRSAVTEPLGLDKPGCCVWCGQDLPVACPSDDFGSGECERAWRRWRNGEPPADPLADEWVSHRRGIPWDEAPVPDAWHCCEPWSVGRTRDRCACGAMRWRGDTTWIDRQTRARNTEAA